LRRIQARHKNVIKFIEIDEKLPAEKAFMYPSQEWKKDMPIFVLKDNRQEKSRWSSQGGQGQLISLFKKDIYFYEMFEKQSSAMFLNYGLISSRIPVLQLQKIYN
jgi:hypothetical protein